MDLQQVVQRFKSWGWEVRASDGLLHSVGAYLSCMPGDGAATLDGSFNADELEAIAFYMRNAVPSTKDAL